MRNTLNQNKLIFNLIFEVKTTSNVVEVDVFDDVEVVDDVINV